MLLHNIVFLSLDLLYDAELVNGGTTLHYKQQPIRSVIWSNRYKFFLSAVLLVNDDSIY